MAMYIILGILFVFLAIYIGITIKGPTRWDRLLGLDIVCTKVILIIIVFASIHNTTYLLDFAIIYALSGFIGVIFIAIFLSKRKMSGRKRGGKK